MITRATGSPFAFGLAVSVTLHTGLFAALTFVSAEQDAKKTRTPVVQFAIGNPLRTEATLQETKITAPKTVRQRQMSPVDVADPAQPALHPASEPRSVTAQSQRLISSMQQIEIPAHQLRDKQVKATKVDRTTQSTLLFDDIDIHSLMMLAEKQPTHTNSSTLAQSAARSTGAHGKNTDQKRGTRSSRTADTRETNPDTAQAADQMESSAPTERSRGGVENGIDVIDLPQPTYPAKCVRLGQQGTVLVSIKVLADGSTETIRLQKSSGYSRLDKAALTAAREARFKPATRDRQPIDATVVVPFEFKLE